MVVDFAVEVQNQATIGGVHRLLAVGRQVEDRQAPMRKTDTGAGVDPGSVVVGAAVRNDVAHPLEEVGVDPTRAYEAGNTAHACALDLPGCR